MSQGHSRDRKKTVVLVCDETRAIVIDADFRKIPKGHGKKFMFYCYLMCAWRRQWHPHSSTLAWKIPWMEEPGRLQSMGSLRVRHD